VSGVQAQAQTLVDESPPRRLTTEPSEEVVPMRREAERQKNS
jgi:hypothetical protein